MTVCPCCGAIMNAEYRSYPVSVGLGTSTYKYSVNVCPECSYEEDSDDINSKMNIAVNDALSDCAHKVLSIFRQNNKNFSDIERNFYLPSRTISKWYNGSKNPSAAAVSLLRIINAFPWIEKAADVGFETEKAQEIARKYYLTQFNTKEYFISYEETDGYQICTACFKKEAKNSGSLCDYTPEYISEKNKKFYLSIK